MNLENCRSAVDATYEGPFWAGPLLLTFTPVKQTKCPSGGTQSGRWCGNKDVTGSETQRSSKTQCRLTKQIEPRQDQIGGRMR